MVRLKHEFIAAFIVAHALALLAFLPWFFSWTGVILLLAGCYVFGTIGINLGFHRLLTHRGFSCPRWLERTIVFIGVCAFQDAPGYWVAIHRKHHQYSDEENDPHSPLVSFFWAHMGWLLAKADEGRAAMTQKYARDIVRDPFYAWIERRNRWLLIAVLSWFAFYAAGFGASLLGGGTASEANQFGMSLMIWGAVLRTVVVWHLTWSVNSVTHVWGYRNYNTPDVSRNNALIAIITSGEGWHNNHHADSRSARHGHMWWEIDLTWLTIRALMLLGLAKDVALPSPVLARKYSELATQLSPGAPLTVPDLEISLAPAQPPTLAAIRVAARPK